MADYYMDIGGNATGPFDETGLRNLARGNGLSRETMVCMVGASTWTTAEKLSFITAEDWDAAARVERAKAAELHSAFARNEAANKSGARGATRPTSEREATLEEVRNGSCYSALRALIGVLKGIGLLGVAIWAFFAVGVLFSGTEGGREEWMNGVAFLFFGLMGVITYFIVEAVTQAMLLGVDAVDLWIAERTDKLEQKIAKGTKVGI